MENEANEQKSGFLGMLLDTLAASLLKSALAGKLIIRAGEGTIEPPLQLILKYENIKMSLNLMVFFFKKKFT